MNVCKLTVPKSLRAAENVFAGCVFETFDIHCGPKKRATFNSTITLAKVDRGVARNLLRRRIKQGVWGRKAPSGVQRQSPGGGMGQSPQKLKT